MSTLASLELIWPPRSTPARAEPRLRVQPPDPLATPQVEDAPVEFVLSVCGRPRCGSVSIQLMLPAAEGVEPQSRAFPSTVWLDLETKSLVRGSDSEADPAFERLDGIIRTQFTDADRQDLRE